MNFRLPYRIGAAALATVLVGAAQAINFDLVFSGGTSAQAQAGFIAAANRWSAIFTDNITIRLDVGTQAMGGGVLGFASSSSDVRSYSDVRSALLGDRKSADDFSSAATLEAGSTFSTLTNRFTNNPAGAGSLTTFTTNLQWMDINTANQKALGIFTGSASAFDAQIRFNSNLSFDFDPTNGISGGQFDFVGVATHEIGHALGFVSGVDYVDSNASSGHTSTQFAWASTLDLFRYSAANTRHLGAGNALKYFSVDGGVTNAGAHFSTGALRGDGNQASHWKDNMGIGILDPTGAPGELLAISNFDIQALDVIGYDVVPEPATLAALGIGVAALLRRRRKA